MTSEKPPHPYHFPFPPYPVQLELMDAITKAIESRAVALFESPTGTGKTLSVICSTMTWLREHRVDPDAFKAPVTPERAVGDLRSGEVDVPDWVAGQAKRKAASHLVAVEDRRAKELVARARAARMGQKKFAATSGLKAKKQRGDFGSGKPRRKVAGNCSEEDRLLLAEPGATFGKDAHNFSGDSSGDEASDRRRTGVHAAKDENADFSPDLSPRLKLVFATRTHSQLAQFVNEVRRTSFASSILSQGEAGPQPSGCGGPSQAPLSVVTFGSRKVMCINDAVRSLPTSGAVSERCRELLAGQSRASSGTPTKRARNGQGASNASGGCRFKNEDVERTMRDTAIVQAHDVEEMAELGSSLGGCPYFSSRAAIGSGAVDVIGVPYAALLHRQTRESLGITIDEHTIVVCDEAHNLIDTVNDIHAATLYRFDLHVALSALAA